MGILIEENKYGLGHFFRISMANIKISVNCLTDMILRNMSLLEKVLYLLLRTKKKYLYKIDQLKDAEMCVFNCNKW